MGRVEMITNGDIDLDPEYQRGAGFPSFVTELVDTRCL